MKAEQTIEQQMAKIQELIMASLEDSKANEATVIDVRKLTNVTDSMIVCSGTSKRHVHTIADHLVDNMKKHGLRPLGVEGDDANEWVLVDLGDAVVHVMLPATRALYDLEKLWTTTEKMRAAPADAS